MSVEFAYGTRRLAVPAALASCPVLAAPGLVAAPDQEALWRTASHDAARRIASLVRGTARVAVIVPDRTRPLPLPALLPVVLDELAAAGIEPGRVTIVPASGIHRPMSRDELALWIGEVAAQSGALLAPHDADAPAVRLGRTPSGIEVAAHPAVAAAGAVLVLGRVVFHYLAGFGGGRKMLIPGVAARRTILAVHARCLSPEAGTGRHPRAITGCLDENPVHAAACEAARLYPPTVALHVQLAPDGGLASAVAGDAFRDHEAACAAYAAAHRVTVDAPLDAVIVSAGGHPTDRDLVQAHKALDAVAPVMKDGGTVVFLAACGDGIGNAEVEDALCQGGATAIETALRRDFRVGGHTALALRQKTTRLDVAAVTELPDAALALAGMRRLASLDEAAATIASRHGSGARIALAPRGGALLYQLRRS